VGTFIIGAGFSKPAGLPLGSEIFPEIMKLAESRGIARNVSDDIKAFQMYLRQTKGIKIREADINLEEFISYLDIEHYLTLEGKDRWSEEGSESQMIIRNLIALLLHSREQEVSLEKWALYEEFVSRLDYNDWIFTFNYDTILEKALTKKKIPFRLFPYRSKEFEDGTIASDNRDEVIVLKMHGSINWFDSTYFQKQLEYLGQTSGGKMPLSSIVFKYPEKFQIRKLIDDPYATDSPLNNIYIVDNLDAYFKESNFLLQNPLIVSPSYNKLLYVNPLREFWYGFNRMGGLENRVDVIGFSLPEHDEYIRQPFYRMITNYQYFQEDQSLINKANLKLVDYRSNCRGRREYKRKYRFVNLKKRFSTLAVLASRLWISYLQRNNKHELQRLPNQIPPCAGFLFRW